MTSFKERYNNDPEYKEKYKQYMYAKVVCDCGFLTARANLYRHKKSGKHEKKMSEIEKLEKRYKK